MMRPRRRGILSASEQTHAFCVATPPRRRSKRWVMSLSTTPRAASLRIKSSAVPVETTTPRAASLRITTVALPVAVESLPRHLSEVTNIMPK